MPELPEVETTRRGISPHVINKTIAEIQVRDHRLRWPVPVLELGALANAVVSDIDRRGKYLLLSIQQQQSSKTLIIHLGMSGSLRIVAAAEPPRMHDHIDMLFSDQVALRYSDPRRFGCWLLTDNPHRHELIVSLGPEPLSDTFDANYLYCLSRKRKVAVKTFIMNAHVVVGVGNIYANEALFMAGINPNRQAGRISLARYQQLVDAIKQVLANAIAQGGTTLRDFVGGDGEPGYFKQSLAVYGRGGQPCRSCKRPLIETRIGQRTTVFCKFCQN